MVDVVCAPSNCYHGVQILTVHAMQAYIFLFIGLFLQMSLTYLSADVGLKFPIY